MVPSDKAEDEIVPDPAEALEFQRVKRVKPRRGGFMVLLLMVLIGGGAGAGWYYYAGQQGAGEDNDVPVIHAAEGPVKVRPKTPGGMAIPDRDKLVYNRLKGAVEEPRVERLLPTPEIPKTPPATVVIAKQPSPDADPVVEEAKLLAKPQKLEPGVTLKKKVAKEPAPQPAVVVNLDAIPQDTQAQPQATTPPGDTPISSLAYQIQIAAVRTNEQAKAEWARLKKKHGDLLAGYALNIVRADLGPDKGIFFRLRAGPIAGEDVAQALCENLSKRKVGCLIVRPGG